MTRAGGKRQAVQRGSEDAAAPRLGGGAERGAAPWPLLARYIDAEARFAERMGAGRGTQFLYEFVRFGLKQAWACLFGALMLTLLLATWVYYPENAVLARYDFLLLAALAIQAVLLATRLETWAEARLIFVFHVVGTVMELVLTSKGSWIYPEPCVLRIANVPLFTGFMYSAVGSFMARSWRLFDFRFTRHPPLWSLVVLSLAIYANFIAKFWIWDLRPLLIATACLLLGPGIIHYKVWRVHRQMPLLLAAGLTALFIWIAENIGTFSAVWLYPTQRSGWHMVSFGKYTSWFLLMIVSYTLVAWLNGPRGVEVEKDVKCEAESGGEGVHPPRSQAARLGGGPV